MAKPITMGEAISAARKVTGHNQKVFAGMLNISASFYNDIEHDRRRPDGAVVERIAKALGLEADYLYFLAGRIPEDVDRDITAERALEAMAAMRHSLMLSRPGASQDATIPRSRTRSA